VCEAPEPPRPANMSLAYLEEFYGKAIEAGVFACIQGSFVCRALLCVYRALLRIAYPEEFCGKAIQAGVFCVYTGLFCVQGSVACI